MYDTLIAEAIGTTDPATVAVVEEVMRVERPALDALSLAQFNRAARTAYADVVLMAAADQLAFYCEALQIETPSVIRI